jgi:hypothetical protein
MGKRINPRWIKVLEYAAWNDVSKVVLAEKTGIPYDTIIRWFRDPVFLKEYEKKCIVTFTEDYIECIRGMIKEAKLGNTQAFREVKPIIQKVAPEINKMIEPHALFLQINQMSSNDVGTIENAEVVQDPVQELQEVHIPDKVHMTPREEKQRVEVIKKTYKKQKVNKSNRNALMRLKRRAVKVGLAPMGFGRPSKTEKAKWLKKLEKLEEKAGIKHPSL